MLVKVKLKFFAQLAQLAGCRECYLEVPSKLYFALEAIEAKFELPIRERLGSSYSVLVNGRGLHSGLGENHILKDQDVLAILPILGGG